MQDQGLMKLQTRLLGFLFFVFFLFLHVRAYKRPPLSMRIWLVFDLDESRIEFILVFIVHLLCHVWML